GADGGGWSLRASRVSRVHACAPAAPFLAPSAGIGLLTVCLGLLRIRAAEPASPAPMGTSLRAATSEPRTVAAAAAVVIAGGTTGVSGLLVPDELHAAGASTGRIGLAVAAAGVLFVAGSTPTASAGRRAVRIPVLLAVMLVLALAFSPAVLTSAPFALVAMLCATTAARSVLWTISYPLAATGAERSGAGLGVVMGLLNGVWAVTVLLGPLLAALAVERLSAQAVFGLTAAACIATLAVTALAAGSLRRARGGCPWKAGRGKRVPGGRCPARPAFVTRCPGRTGRLRIPPAPTAARGPTPPSS